MRGLKTYSVVVAAIIAALLGYLTGEVTLLQALQGVGVALGLGGNRAVIKLVEILNSRFQPAQMEAAAPRMAVIYGGVALAIVSALTAQLLEGQNAAVTITVILNALGLNFLGQSGRHALTLRQ